MPELAFVKYHGLGNDFVVLDARREGAQPIGAADAVFLCDRHRGIGADGVITLLPPRVPEAAFRMHISNADGTVAEMCGNGLRCVVQHVLDRGEPAPGASSVVVDTDAGLLRGTAAGGGRIKVELGEARIDPAPLSVLADGHPVEGVRVSVGNPHFVLRPYAPGTELFSFASRLGPPLERHAAFPNRTNVELFAPNGRGIDLVVFERGVGITQACGTGAGAAAFAALLWGLADNPVEVRLPGGPLIVDVARSADGLTAKVAIEGEAVRVFEGTVRVPREAG